MKTLSKVGALTVPTVFTAGGAIYIKVNKKLSLGTSFTNLFTV
jgi:hypothetical protein